MLGQEVCDGVLAKGVGDAAVVLAPSCDGLGWVRPKEIAQQAGIGHVCGPWYPLHLLQGLQFGRQAPMHAENLQSNLTPSQNIASLLLRSLTVYRLHD